MEGEIDSAASCAEITVQVRQRCRKFLTGHDSAFCFRLPFFASQFNTTFFIVLLDWPFASPLKLNSSLRVAPGVPLVR